MKDRAVGVPSAIKGRCLWRVCGAGGFGLYRKWDAKLKKVPKVIRGFVAYSEVVPKMIADGSIIYNA